MKDIYQVIKKVRLSEKATLLQETNNEVVFEVDRDANKLDIKRAVEALLGKAAPTIGRKLSSASRTGKRSTLSEPLRPQLQT
jgi:large subunit ribosomal protein L23